ncbi:hypothetical protein NOR51B_1211 [Luminiphilus syltensis NOR5-1B]|uniref:General secretion pathway protein M n=1 Tax=Luminiphilus syltensis NOR5-1B TaxID=565045 RepID=B8KWY9_9GAMM|nr:type II secretion system protein GspM [Luminiphilus syltensis]EED35266.1 hypothetical protein NOR51B_1211 [Luminiphilus syltensis NOR5-1B]
MKAWLRNHRRSALFVGATLVLPLYLFFSLVGSLVSVGGDYRDQIDAIEPRLARMRGLIEFESALQAELDSVGGQVADQIYPSGSGSETVAAALQSEARRVLADAGLEITNSQVLEIRRQERFDYIAVKIVARGELAQLDQALSSISAFRPLIFVEAFDLFPNRQSNRRGQTPEQTLTVSMQLMSVRSAL